MTLWLDRNGKRLYQGHVLDVLAELPAESVQCVVTSPPYFGLRAYGTDPRVWGGDPECPHNDTVPAEARPMTGGTGPASAKQVTNSGSQVWNEERVYIVGGGTAGSSGEAFSSAGPENAARIKAARWRNFATCTLCGAWRGELGSEPTPALFVAHLVEVFRAVRRVLRRDGVCFLNIGDSYNGSGKGPTTARSGLNGGAGVGPAEKVVKRGAELRQGFVDVKTDAPGLKPKDLCLIPERLAIALQDDGWWVRSRIAWCKRAPMPESVTDRPTSAWEHVWMMSKNARYFWDAEGVKEPYARVWSESNGGSLSHPERFPDGSAQKRGGKVYPVASSGANLRNFWLLSPEPFPAAHFATFPTEIPRRCIKAASRPGDVVLDPFAGSGTTLKVAHELGREAWGIELNPEYCRLAERRLRQDVLPLEVV